MQNAPYSYRHYSVLVTEHDQHPVLLRGLMQEFDLDVVSLIDRKSASTSLRDWAVNGDVFAFTCFAEQKAQVASVLKDLQWVCTWYDDEHECWAVQTSDGSDHSDVERWGVLLPDLLDDEYGREYLQVEPAP